MIRRRYHIDFLVQLGDMPDDLDAAMALHQHVHLRVQRFEGFLQLVEGTDQASRAEDAQGDPFLRGRSVPPAPASAEAV